MKRPLLVFFVCELAYLAVARTFTHTYGGDEVSKELWWNAIRVVSLAVLLPLYWKMLTAPSSEPKRVAPYLFLSSGMFLVPILTGYANLPSPLDSVYAATSLIVGLREEVAYRAILQTALQRRWGFLPALLISNICFLFYHLGTQPFTLHNMWSIFSAGLILGLAYRASGSLVLVIGLHTFYDVFAAYSPILNPPLPEYVGSCISAVVVLALALTQRTRIFPTNPPFSRP